MTTVILAASSAVSMPSLAAAQTGVAAETGEPADSGSSQLIAAELRDLEQARAEISLGGPIVLSAVGGGVIVVGATVFLMGLLLETVCPRENGSEGGPLYSSDCAKEDDSAGEVMIVGGVIGLAGGVALGFGLTSLFSRIADRRQLGQRIKELRTEQKRLSPYGDLRLQLGPGHAEITGQWRF